jgi:hypothetical protein
VLISVIYKSLSPKGASVIKDLDNLVAAAAPLTPIRPAISRLLYGYTNSIP